MPAIRRLVLVLPLLAAAATAAPFPATSPSVMAEAEKEGKIIIYSTTDTVSASPLLKDFAALYPKITVEYNDMNSTELYNRFISEVAAGSGSGDFLWSSAMDLQMKLTNDRYAPHNAHPQPTRPP